MAQSIVSVLINLVLKVWWAEITHLTPTTPFLFPNHDILSGRTVIGRSKRVYNGAEFYPHMLISEREILVKGKTTLAAEMERRSFSKEGSEEERRRRSHNSFEPRKEDFVRFAEWYLNFTGMLQEVGPRLGEKVAFCQPSACKRTQFSPHNQQPGKILLKQAFMVKDRCL